MNIAIGQIVHETNTFSSSKAKKADFKAWEWGFNQEIFDSHHDVQDYLGGMIAKANERNITIVPTFSAFTRPAGVIEQETYREIKRHFIDNLTAIENLDAICFNLHGAGVAEDVQDIEGDLLESTREHFGLTIPIVITLDLHANITNKMARNADAFITVKEYPHIDSYDVGLKAMELTLQMVMQKIEPKMAFYKLPLTAALTTSYLSPVQEINKYCREFEEDSQVIECSFVHGFPYADIEENGSSIIVVTKNSLSLADEIAAKVGQFVMKKKEAFFPPLLSPTEGVKKAMDIQESPVVINESSDNPGGGGAGDSTHLLKAMIEAKVSGACMGTIYDRNVVEEAAEAGVGQTIAIVLGGKTEPKYGSPLKVTAYVKSITDGQFTQISPMWKGMDVDMGTSVRLVIEDIDVIVCSKRSQVFDSQIFNLHGIDVEARKIIGVKSSNHFRAYFSQISNNIITVNGPGLSSADFTKFDFTHAPRTNYPLSEM